MKAVLKFSEWIKTEIAEYKLQSDATELFVTLMHILNKKILEINIVQILEFKPKENILKTFSDNVNIRSHLIRWR